ncbi:MAG TPA: cytochrome P450 [Ignavibacteria bacterium]|nr:cytochrome P450 [Ignavibacteria bacterium]
MTLSQKFRGWYTSTPVLRIIFGFLRSFQPVAIVGKNVYVTKYKDVADVLVREDDFTVYEIDGHKMKAMGSEFILGLDASPETTRDREMLAQVIKREDLAPIREYIRKIANDLINAKSQQKRINVVNEYARLACVKLVADYFGVPTEDPKTMMNWQRDCFNEAFVNLNNDKRIHDQGIKAAKEVGDHLRKLISERKIQTEPLDDNILNRLIAKQKDNSWLDDEAVRRNILCILGVVENTSKVVTQIIDQLLKRPVEFQKAKLAADANDIETVKKYSFEALRFNPHNPAVVRFCKHGSVIGKGTKHEKIIPQGKIVYAATLGAMFDPEVVKNPNEFDPERTNEFMHFGYGPHLCTGKYISEVTVPELVAGLLRQKNLRRAPGKEGKILYDEIVFPDRLILEFD